jgi:hypothetical protein
MGVRSGRALHGDVPRLTANDSQFTSTDDVIVTINPAN